MPLQLPHRPRPRCEWDAARGHWALGMREPQHFIDLVLNCAGVSDGGEGAVTVQAMRTTAAILGNENESLLIDDLGRALARWAPNAARYSHDDFERLTANITPEKRPNSHSRARAMALQISTTLDVIGSEDHQRRWQRIFPVELDGSRSREVAVTTVCLLGTRSRTENAIGSDFPGQAEEQT